MKTLLHAISALNLAMFIWLCFAKTFPSGTAATFADCQTVLLVSLVFAIRADLLEIKEEAKCARCNLLQQQRDGVVFFFKHGRGEPICVNAPRDLGNLAAWAERRGWVRRDMP